MQEIMWLTGNLKPFSPEIARGVPAMKAYIRGMLYLLKSEKQSDNTSMRALK